MATMIRLLNSREAAKFLGISARTLFTLRQRGVLPTVNISDRGRRFDMKDLQDLIDKRKQGGTNDPGEPLGDEADEDDDGPIDPNEENK